MALHGIHEYFEDKSKEEREHADKFMTYQNKRGGRIVLQDIKVWTQVFNIGLYSSYCLCIVIPVGPMTDA